MPRHPKIKPVFVETETPPWKVDLPATISPTGKRARFFFETKVLASNFADQQRIKITNFGTAGVSNLSPSEAQQAAKAFADLKPFDVALNEVITDWITRKKARDTTASFASASRQYLEHLEIKKVKGRTVSAAYKKQIRLTFPRFSALNPLPLTDITSKAIAACMGKMTPTVRNAHLRVLSAFFSWCSEVPREWLRANPATQIPKLSIGKTEVEIYSPEDVAKLLIGADSELQPYLFFGFFSGIRPNELERLSWSNVDSLEGFITLPASITKTGSRRNIKIHPTLSAWIADWTARNGLHIGRIVPSKNLLPRLKALRESLGVELIQDGMRHSFASYWLAVHKNEHELREMLGHKSANELWDHYHRACTEKEANQFWAIRPHSAKVPHLEKRLA